MILATGIRCDECGIEEHQPEMINPFASVFAEGNWWMRRRDVFDDGAHLCPDCYRRLGSPAGYFRN